MDERETTIAPGVTREDSAWGYTLKGMKGMLLASGLAKEEWFWNGRRASDGRRLTTVHFKIDGNRARCKPNHWTEGEYIIEVDYPKEEVRKRRKAQQQKEAANKAEENLNLGVVMTAAAFNCEGNPDNPWRFPAETIDQVKRHLREMIRLFESGGFEVRPSSRLESDAAFQRFVGRAVGAPSDSAAGA